MSRKIEVCVKCKREYDGAYPCLCGCEDFEIMEECSKKEVEE